MRRLTNAERNAAIEGITIALLDLAEAEQLYTDDAAFHIHMDTLARSLPGMVRGLAEQCRQDAVKRATVQDLLRHSAMTIDQAARVADEAWGQAVAGPPES